MRLIDADACPALFDEEFKETRQLILQGETHLDNLAEGFSEATRVIRVMPTIDPESLRPKGRWIWDANAMDWGLGGWVCGECHARNDNIPAKPDVFPYAWTGSHYCPNCGAKMEG